MLQRISEMPQENIKDITYEDSLIFRDPHLFKIINSDIHPKKKGSKTVKKNVQPKVDSSWNNEMQISKTQNVDDKDMLAKQIECLKGQDDEIICIYQSLAKEYEMGHQKISARVVQEFKNIRSPTYSEYNIGIALLYILACVDTSIVLSYNNKEVFDVSWEAIQSKLSSAGIVCRYLRNMRTHIETKGISENFLKYINYHMQNCYSENIQSELNDASLILFEYLLNTYKLAECLMPFQITEFELRLPPFINYGKLLN